MSLGPVNPATPKSTLVDAAGTDKDTAGAADRQQANSASSSPCIPVLDREAAIQAAKTFYDEEGPFAKIYTMQVVAAYQNSPTRWSIEYTTSPPSAKHLVQFVYEPVEPKNRSLGNLALRLEGLPASYYWRWRAASMDAAAGTRVEVKSKSPRASRARTAKATKEAASTRGNQQREHNSTQQQAAAPSAERMALV
jgi:hypothetical protein